MGRHLSARSHLRAFGRDGRHCRNFLIYVNVETQKKLLQLMHYALKPGGLLILGSAESIGGLGHLFTPLDQKWKVFQRLEVSERSFLEMPANVLPHERTVVHLAERVKEPVMDIFYGLPWYGRSRITPSSLGQ